MKLRKIFLISIAVILIVIIGFVIINYNSIDRSGKLSWDGLCFKDEEYTTKYFASTGEGKKIGKADGWDIREIPEDKEHNFLAVRSFLDNFCVIKNSYEIPTEGNINVVYLNHIRVQGNLKLNEAIEYLLSDSFEDSFNIKTDNVEHYTNTTVYVGYEDCPVGTEFVGMVGCVNEKLVYIKPTEYQYKENGARAEQIYSCYVISDQYKDVFEGYNVFDSPKEALEVVE